MPIRSLEHWLEQPEIRQRFRLNRPHVTGTLDLEATAQSDVLEIGLQSFQHLADWRNTLNREVISIVSNSTPLTLI